MRTIRRAAFTLAAAAAAVPRADAQQADLRIMSAAIGYGSARIADVAPVPDRVMAGANMRADLHVLSLLLRRLPLRTYDALTVDYTYGRMTSDPLTFSSLVEDRSNVVFVFGYQFLAGVQRGGVAVLAGLGRREFTNDIGGSSMDGTATPAIVRLEVGRARPVVVTGWVGLGGEQAVGGRVDVPFFRRLNLTAMLWRQDGAAELWTSVPGVTTPAQARMLMVGVRSAEVR